MKKDQIKKIVKEELRSVLTEGSQASKDFADLVALIKGDEQLIVAALATYEWENPTKGRALSKAFRTIYKKIDDAMNFHDQTIKSRRATGNY